MILTDDEILNSLIINNKDHLIDRVPSLTDEQKQKAKDFFKKYSNYENKIDWNKLKTLTWKDFESVFELANQSKSAKKSDVRSLFGGDEFRIVNEDDNFIYVSPLTYEAAKFMDSYNCGGAGAKWCIGWNDSRRYWHKYRRDGDVFCLIMTKPNAQTTLYEQFKKGTVAVMSNMDETDNKAMCQISKNGKVTVWSQVEDARIVTDISISDLSTYGFDVPTDIYEMIRPEVERLQAESVGDNEIESEYGRAVRQFLIEENGEANDMEMLNDNEHFWSGNGKEWKVFTDEEADEEWEEYLRYVVDEIVDYDLDKVQDYVDERWFEDFYNEDVGYYWDDDMSTDDKIEWILDNSRDVEETEEWFDVDEDGNVDRTSPKFDVDDYRDEYIEDRSGTWDGYNYASTWYRETFGDGNFTKTVSDYNLFDKDAYIESIMRYGDRASDISTYDGREHEVTTDDGTFFIYREA